MIAFNDADDLLFEVCYRGPPPVRITMDSLESNMCTETIANTNEHKAYPRVMKELE